MLQTTQATSDRIRVISSEVDVPRMDIGLSKFGLGVIVTMSALIGVWGVVCLVGGLGSCGSFQELGRGLITAVTGM